MEEAPVEEQDEELGRAPALAHHRRVCHLFHPSLGGDHLVLDMTMIELCFVR